MNIRLISEFFGLLNSRLCTLFQYSQLVGFTTNTWPTRRRVGESTRLDMTIQYILFFFRSLTDSTTLSNIDWYSTPINFDLDELSSNASCNQQTKTSRTMLNSEMNSSLKRTSRRKASKSNEFKSKSMSFPSSSGQTLVKSPTVTSSMEASVPRLNSSVKSGSFSLDSSRSQLSKPNSSNNKVTLSNRSHLPIKISMSRSSMRKKQVEIMNEYNRYNTLELLNSLRQIQKNLDTKVKQFANNRLELDSKV